MAAAEAAKDNDVEQDHRRIITCAQSMGYKYRAQQLVVMDIPLVKKRFDDTQFNAKRSFTPPRTVLNTGMEQG